VLKIAALSVKKVREKSERIFPFGYGRIEANTEEISGKVCHPERVAERSEFSNPRLPGASAQ
jgi:hypothetical protein